MPVKCCSITRKYGLRCLNSGERRDVQIGSADIVKVPEAPQFFQKAFSHAAHPVVAVLRGIGTRQPDDKLIETLGAVEQTVFRAILQRELRESFIVQLQ